LGDDSWLWKTLTRWFGKKRTPQQTVSQEAAQ